MESWLSIGMLHRKRCLRLRPRVADPCLTLPSPKSSRLRAEAFNLPLPCLSPLDFGSSSPSNAVWRVVLSLLQKSDAHSQDGDLLLIGPFLQSQNRPFVEITSAVFSSSCAPLPRAWNFP